MNFDMIGPAIALGLSAIGSSIGCGIGGMASHAIMSRVEEGHGKFIIMSVMPSSQIIYGFVLMYLMRDAVREGALAPISAIAIGLFSGLAIMVSAIYQGRAAATGIQASAKQPAVFGKCLVTLGIVESFALFAFVFGRMLIY